MVIHMNHSHGPCPAPEILHDPFVVMDMNGFHVLKLHYCGCSQGNHLERFEQLLREAWYPASHDRPRTAFTFDFLDTYHKLTLQGKLNLFDFYRGILQKTDNCGQTVTLVCPQPYLSSTSELKQICSTGTTSSLDASGNGEISRCVKEEAALTSPRVWKLLQKALLPSSVLAVLTPVGTSP